MSELPLEGVAAPPRRNGELDFAEPWQSRIFGLTVALNQRGVFAWSEFQAALIAEISQWEAAGHAPESWDYWERWRAALEELLEGKRVFAGAELADRVDAFRARPLGHDHRH